MPSKENFEIIFLNTKLIEDLKIDEHAFLNQSFDNIFPSLAKLKRDLKFVFKTGKTKLVDTNETEILSFGNLIFEIEIKKYDEFLILEMRNKAEQKKSELEWKEKEQMLDESNRMLDMAVWTLDMQTGKITSTIDLQSFFELPADKTEIDLNDYYKFLVSDDIEKSKATFQEAIKKGVTFSHERKMVTCKGNEKFIEVSCKPIFENSNCIKVVGTVRDITNRKKQEQKLIESEFQLKENAAMIKVAHDLLSMGTYALHLKENRIIISEKITEILDLPISTKEISVAEYADTIQFENNQESFDLVIKNVLKKNMPYHLERKIKTKKGNIKYVENTGQPIFENTGEVKFVGTLRDITKRKEEENLLKETQRKLNENALLLQQTHERLKMGTYEMDVNSGKIETTFNLSKFLELANKRTEFTIDEFYGFVDEEERHSSKLNVRHAIAKGYSYVKERKIITEPGSIKYLEITGQPVFENGKCVKLFGTFRDISERRKAEIKLQLSDLKVKENVERLMTAHRLLRTGTWSLNLENNHLSLSDEVLEITQHRIPKELPLLDFFNFVPQQFQAGYMETLMLSLNTFVPVTEVMKLQFDDGTHIYVDVIGQFSDNKKTLNGTFRDITEEHEKDLAIVKSEERMRELFDGTPSMYFIMNSDGLIEDVNQFGSDYLGFRKEELIGHHHDILFHAEDKATVLKNLELLKNSADNFLQWEVRKRKKTGEIIWVKETARLSTNKSGEKIFLIVCEDITNEIINRTLVRKKQEELIYAKEKAEDAARAKQQFASIMSHEIRTPLNAVIGMTNLLLMENPRENQINELNTLKFSAENLLLLVNDILDFSKIEAGKVVLEKIEFEPRKMIHNLKNSYQFKADEKGIFINTFIDEDIPMYLFADTTRLSQILNNLVSNAIKFTEKGIVEISLRQLPHLNHQESKIRFEISDTGIGIPKEKINTIFESFSQANTDTTRKYGGSGLGLTITQKLIELHRSNIFVESEVGKGTTFYFDLILPIGHINKNVDEEQSVYEEKKFDSKKILLVEDNPLNQIIACRFLEKWGVEVDIADNGIKALEILNNRNYDLILMDIHMPEMNGIEATKIIRTHENKLLHNIPIIAITAAAMENDKEKLLSYGLNDYVSKPFNPEDLQKKLADYLS